MSKKRKSNRVPVTVVAAASAFPDFSSFSSFKSSTKKSTKKDNTNNNNNNNGASSTSNDFDFGSNNNNDSKSSLYKKGIEIDFNETVQEIRELGSSQFTGKQKRQYEAEQYKALTGREKKMHKVPIKIVRGIKKKAAMREKRREEEARESGLVTASTMKKKEKRGYSVQKRRDTMIHGPAPDIGYTKKGVLSVRKERR